jgi:peroxiredoxin Q/BCP
MFGPTLPAGLPAPDFEAADHPGRSVRLSGLRGRFVVLVFYPADNSPG